MFNRFIHLTICFLIFNFLTTIATCALPPQHKMPASWLGTYEFHEFAAPNQNRMYKLIILPANNGLRAKLQVDGFQTLIRVRGPAIVTGHKCTIIFRSNYTDKNLNIPVPNFFKSNETILTLEKQNGKLITHWGALSPLLLTHQKPGIYFKHDR